MGKANRKFLGIIVITILAFVICLSTELLLNVPTETGSDWNSRRTIIGWLESIVLCIICTNVLGIIIMLIINREKGISNQQEPRKEKIINVLYVLSWISIIFSVIIAYASIQYNIENYELIKNVGLN